MRTLGDFKNNTLRGLGSISDSQANGVAQNMFYYYYNNMKWSGAKPSFQEFVDGVFFDEVMNQSYTQEDMPSLGRMVNDYVDLKGTGALQSLMIDFAQTAPANVIPKNRAFGQKIADSSYKVSAEDYIKYTGAAAAKVATEVVDAGSKIVTDIMNISKYLPYAIGGVGILVLYMFLKGKSNTLSKITGNPTTIGQMNDKQKVAYYFNEKGWPIQKIEKTLGVKVIVRGDFFRNMSAGNFQVAKA